MLTDMMDSPVIWVPQLGQAPPAMLSNVFVFKNGIRPQGASGPFGFQPDTFDSAPGDDDYSPLRRLHMVSWPDESKARVLTSDRQIRAMKQEGRIVVEPTNIVVNMPFLTWPGGAR